MSTYINRYADFIFILIRNKSDMDVSLVLLGVLWCPANLGLEVNPASKNLTNSTNDMYVIHGTVYQVGIITNKSNDEIANMTGNQEALSFYHSNGSAVDLSWLPAPLLTNVTAHSVVAVASAPAQPRTSSTPLDLLAAFISGNKSSTVKRSANFLQRPSEENLAEEQDGKERGVFASLFRRSAGNSSNDPAIKVVKETSLIPPKAGLTSIRVPDLLGLNTNSVPLPIPNTSVVRYAEISTLVKAP